ncbi:MAG: hypothetical protein R3E56_10940 [Burkholderiaceae bacterium]
MRAADAQITAPQDGQATLVSAEVGQTIDSSQALLTVIPADSNCKRGCTPRAAASVLYSRVTP